MLRLSPAFFEESRTGDVISRLTADTALLEQVVGSSVSMALRNLIMGVWALVMLMLTSAKLTLLVLLGVSATLLQQSAFHAGSLQTSVPTMLVLEPVIAIVLGAIVLNEHMQISALEPIALAAAAAAMIAATIALGRDEGAYEEKLEAELAERVA